MKVVTSRLSILITFLAVTAFLAVPASASIIINVQSVTVMAGSTNDSLNVSLTNTGPDSVTIAGFSFGISTANPGITFTSADYATIAPYIFSGASFDQDFSFPLATATGASLQASDTYDGAGGTVVASGATFGLGRVIFDVGAGTASGLNPVTLAAYPATSLSDPAGANINFTGNGGVITVIPASTIPEPATFALLGGALGLIGIVRRKQLN